MYNLLYSHDEELENVDYNTYLTNGSRVVYRQKLDTTWSEGRVLDNRIYAKYIDGKSYTEHLILFNDQTTINATVDEFGLSSPSCMYEIMTLNSARLEQIRINLKELNLIKLCEMWKERFYHPDTGSFVRIGLERFHFYTELQKIFELNRTFQISRTT